MSKQSKVQFKLFLKFTKHLLPYWKKETAILGLSGIAVLLGLVNPYLTKLVIDRAFGNKDLRVFIILVLIGGTIFVLNGLVNGLKNYLDRQIKIKINFDLDKKVFRHLEKLDLDYFRNRSTGEHLYRVNYDISSTANFITTTPPQVIATFPKLLFILIIVLRLNWQMAVFAICLAPLLYLPSYYFTMKMKKIWEDLIKNSEGIFKSLSQFFSRILLIKAFGKEASETRDYLKKRIANIRISVRNTRLEVISGFAGSIVNKVIIGLIAFYGGYKVIKGELSLGSLTAIMMYIGQLIGLQNSFAGFFQSIVLGLVSCQRVEDILCMRSKIINADDAREVIFRKGKISFRNVGFGYNKEQPVLKDINFDIEGGSRIAIVGPSGCGKTTVLNLIMRLYDPWSGYITIDGVNIKNLKLASLKKQIGIVLQEPFLRDDTVENNIKYGRKDAEVSEILEISKICGVDDFVKGLPNGYQAIIGEDACKLSEGQKQKIAIARALVKRPKILILDEAMSSMDSASEERILKNIKELQADVTTIIVSHRLSTVLSANLVYFLKGTNEIIIGAGEDLLHIDKEFCNLFATQIRDEGLQIMA